MKNENYFMLDGEKIPMSEETYESIKAKVLKQNRSEEFDKVGWYKEYYYISDSGKVRSTTEADHLCDRNRRETANYFRPKGIAEHIAKIQELQRQLFKYSMQYGGDKIDWDDQKQYKYSYHIAPMNDIVVGEYKRNTYDPCKIYFISKKVCQDAVEKFLPLIEEIYERKLTLRR